jgi:glycosyltransferase involved in cell wall biosynthesis
MATPLHRKQRPVIAFFDYHDVFEDFYSHYGVDQEAFATRWDNTANHLFLRLIQREVGDVVWYAFSLDPQLSQAQHETVGCRVRMLRSSLVHRFLWRSFYLSKHAWRWRGAYPAYAVAASYMSLLSISFARALQRDRPDFFFVQDYASGRYDVLVLTARLMRIPLIARHSGSCPEGYVGRFTKRWTIPRADRLITSSQAETNLLASRYRVPRKRMHVILTPIETELYRPLERSEACRAAGLAPSHRYLLFVGRLQDQVKRVSALIRSFATAARETVNIDLLIVGEGPDKDKLVRLADACMPGRVRFLGWVASHEEKTRLYNTADCLVLPSRSEGFPTVVGEAMACGTPVLASRVGGVGELVIEDETGWLLPPGDDRRLVQGLAGVLGRPEQVTAMRPKARAVAEQRVSPTAVGRALKACFATARERYARS